MKPQGTNNNIGMSNKYPLNIACSFCESAMLFLNSEIHIIILYRRRWTHHSCWHTIGYDMPPDSDPLVHSPVDYILLEAAEFDAASPNQSRAGSVRLLFLINFFLQWVALTLPTIRDPGICMQEKHIFPLCRCPAQRRFNALLVKWSNSSCRVGHFGLVGKVTQVHLILDIKSPFMPTENLVNTRLIKDQWHLFVQVKTTTQVWKQASKEYQTGQISQQRRVYVVI